MKLSTVLGMIREQLLTMGFDPYVEVPETDPPVKMSATLGRVTTGDGYLANAEEGFWQDGTTRFCGDTDLAKRKALAEKHLSDPEFQNMEPRMYRYAVLTGLIVTELPIGTFGVGAYAHQYDIPMTLDSYAADNEAKGSGHTV
jgi:hypothetical protein